MAVLPDLEPCTKYEITMTKYIGLKSDETNKNKQIPVYKGETGASLSAYTAIDSSMPFNLKNIKIKEELSSISLFWSNNELPCIDMISMLSFQVCENKDKTSCFKEGVSRKNNQKIGSSITTKFDELHSCTSYLVSRKFSIYVFLAELKNVFDRYICYHQITQCQT